MRLAVLSTLLLALAVPAAAQVSPPASPPVAPATPRAVREAVVANNTDRTLRELYIFLPGADPGPDRLGTSVLPARATLRVTLERGDCTREVRGVLEDGEEIRRRQNLCTAPRIVFADTGPRREVTLANDSDLMLREFYAWPAGTRAQGPDRLGSGTLAAGESQALRLRNLPACLVDLRAVFDDDSEVARDRVDICRAPRIAFGDANAPRREVEVTNISRRTLRELYARPAGGGPGWGPDRLGAGTIARYAGFALRLRGGCSFDFRVVYENDEEELRPGFDVCAERTIVFAGRAGPGGSRSVTFVNGHGATIQQIFLSPAEEGDWGDDALGADVLPRGSRQTVTAETGCRADVRIVFENGAAEERRDIDVCALDTIAFRPGWTVEERLGTPTGPRTGRVLLRNGGPVPVVELYADPPGGARGADRLGAAVIGVGDALDFAPPETLPRDGARCPADLFVVFRDGRELRLADRDLCSGEELVLR